jgi:hypothetical protein
MRKNLLCGVVWVAGLVAGCSSSSVVSNRDGGDDGTPGAAGIGQDASHEAASNGDAHGDAPRDAAGGGADANAEASSDASSDATTDASAEGAADSPTTSDSGDAAALTDASDAPAASDSSDVGTTSDTGTDGTDATSDAGTDAGPLCYAMRIGQASATVSAPSTGWSLGTGDWTLETWIKAHDAFAGGSVFVLNEATLTNDVRLAYDSTTGNVKCTTYSGSCPCGKGTGNMSLSAGPIHDGAWHHVACIHTGGVGKLYVDGAESDTDIVTTSLTPTSDIAFGQASDDAGGATNVAAPVLVGPFRFSNVVRYVSSFTPAHTWSLDANTVTQYLVAGPFAGALVDEAGGKSTSTSASGVTASPDTPCCPGCQ